MVSMSSSGSRRNQAIASSCSVNPPLVQSLEERLVPCQIRKFSLSYRDAFTSHIRLEVSLADCRQHSTQTILYIPLSNI